MQDFSGWSLAALGGASALAVHSYFNFRPQNLRHIPTVGGSSDPLVSFINAIRVDKDIHRILDEGYARYKGKVFKFPTMGRWLVIVNGPELVNEIRSAPDDQMSFHEFSTELLHLRYTIGDDVADDPYHTDVITNKLTKNLSSVFPLVLDEVREGFADEVGDASEWVTLSAQKMFMTIVARATNRVFVGLPLCRNPEYLRLVVQYTIDVNLDRNWLDFAPALFRPLVGLFFTRARKTVAECAKILGPVVRQRLEDIQEHGKQQSDGQEDMLQWLYDAASGPNRDIDALTRRIMILNFAAIHTSSSTILHAVYHLATNPDWIKPLREEVEAVIAAHGWNKIAMTKMHKIDSLLREAARLHTISAFSMQRATLKDLHLSTGDFIPSGTFISTPATSVHKDADNYDQPGLFDPWRFASVRENEGENAKYQFVKTNSEYVVFGHGKHACPGRFFAANELKLMLAHLVLNYDVQFPGGSRERPPNMVVGPNCVPNPGAKVCLRKRQS